MNVAPSHTATVMSDGVWRECKDDSDALWPACWKGDSLIGSSLPSFSSPFPPFSPSSSFLPSSIPCTLPQSSLQGIMWLSDTQKIGVGLTAFGLFFMLMGVMMFFDGGLLAIGNVSRDRQRKDRDPGLPHHKDPSPKEAERNADWTC